MTDEEALDLGRRFAACKGFRPMRGMLDNHGRTWTPDLLWRWTPKVDIPDLRDPATRGCALALVREAWGDPWGHVAVESGTYTDAPHWYVRAGGFDSYCNSEAEALVFALETAP